MPMILNSLLKTEQSTNQIANLKTHRLDDKPNGANGPNEDLPYKLTHSLQGYFAHTRAPPPRNLQQEYA